MTRVARTCTELSDDDESASAASGQPLAAFRECAAYVLLGDPGMGKTTAFEEESRVLGADAVKVDARDFVCFDPADRSEWRGRTLFIDGLDEVRAGGADPRTPFDAIRSKLDTLGKPRFRLSCRHADWLETDQKRLEDVSASGKVAVLRLDPLDAPARAELLAIQQMDDPEAFLQDAEQRGMAGLLDNPQSLVLLAQSVQSRNGNWPESRRDVFENACLEMAKERNDEHLSSRPAGDPSQILDTAGYLCALLLISGKRGFAKARSQANADYLYMGDCGIEESDWRQAAASTLFRFPEAHRAEPIHRHIAEYLAGRRLAQCIDGGLSILRVLALISGQDGTVVSELRGLSAWLAAYSRKSRLHLFERDAIGVALYGDIGQFSSEEKRDLFHSLLREPRQLGRIYKATAFAPLATPAMLDVLRDALDNPPGGDDAPWAVEFVLLLLREASPLPALAPVLLPIIRDTQRWPLVRHAALNAFIHYCSDPGCDAQLQALLGDIRDGKLDDPDDQLLGTLLSTLYPEGIAPSTIWDYFKETEQSFFGRYKHFWIYALPENASDDAVAELLDAFVARMPELASDSTLRTCVVKLLVRGLQIHGEGIDDQRLYRWLDAGLRLTESMTRDSTAEIRAWIQEHPERHAGLLREWIRRPPPDDDSYLPEDRLARLFGATLSVGACEVGIAAAKSMIEQYPWIAQSLLWIAVQSGRIDASRMRELVAEDAALTTLLDRLIEPAQPSPRDVQREKEHKDHIEEQRIEEHRKLVYLKDNIEDIRSKKSPPNILYRIARVYFGFDEFSVKFTPEQAGDRLKQWVGCDAELFDALRSGLCQTVHREDIPDVGAILKLRLDSKISYLCWPYLAGLEMEQEHLPRCWWTRERMRKALAIYFAYRFGDYQPAWYGHLLDEHANIVAEVLIDIAKAVFPKDIGIASVGIWPLAFDPKHAQVASHACLPLLRAFPAQAGSKDLSILDQLLLAAYRHADRAAFEELIRERSDRKNMPPRQRGRWLAAGCAVATGAFADAARAFACQGRKQERTLHLASFFCPEERGRHPAWPFSADLAALLIRLVGRFNGPRGSGGGYVTPSMRASDMVHACIRTLGSSPEADATAALESLLADSELMRWRDALTTALDDQRIIRRDHAYRHPTFEQAKATLAQGAPASAADLAALVLDRLDGIALRMRSGNTDAWKQCWNEDRHGRPKERKREESCTNVLLQQLRHSTLPDGVNAEPEMRYPNNAKTDIRISHADYHIPLEIKCNDHEKLWRAVKDQLLAKYASDPATGGYGIYVVLWFGTNCTQRPPEGGERPATPDDLRQLLEATLSDRERRFIHIRVIDVSVPAASA